jgi:hypothetical protein
MYTVCSQKIGGGVNHENHNQENANSGPCAAYGVGYGNNLIRGRKNLGNRSCVSTNPVCKRGTLQLLDV